MKPREFFKYPIEVAELDFTKQIGEIIFFTLAYDTDNQNKDAAEDYLSVGKSMNVAWDENKRDTPNKDEYIAGQQFVKDYFHGCYFQYPIQLFWDFVYPETKKTEYDYVLFRALQAAKSLVGMKVAFKCNNEMLLARMCGYRKSTELKEKGIPEHLAVLKKYYTRKRMEKLRRDLERIYHLKTLSTRGCRGYWITTIDMPWEMFANYIKMRQDTKKEKQKQIETEKAKALKILEG